MNRRFIEDSFPLEAVSLESTSEKSVRHGHISTLHIWWARRPLASSRATIYASLIPSIDDENQREKENEFIADLSKWDNSLNEVILNKARNQIFTQNGATAPRVLDPFGGGGAIPLEALRLGCETYSSDINPVSVFIQKCSIEYPQKFGEQLIPEVEKWGKKIFNETKEQIGKFYPEQDFSQQGLFSNSKAGLIPVGYIWARTIPCQNPLCNAQIPLIKQYWLVKKKSKQIVLFPCKDANNISFELRGNGFEIIPEDFDPLDGTVSRGVAKCLICGNVISAPDVKKQFIEGKASLRLIAGIYYKKGQKGKIYRIATEADSAIYKEAEEQLELVRSRLLEKWGFSPVPDEDLPPKNTLGFGVQPYGMKKWGDLFNARQLLALISFADNVRNSYVEMIKEEYDPELAKIITSYLAIILDRLVDKNAALVIYNSVGEKIEHVFGRQTVQMSWDFAELNVFSEVNGDWLSNLNWVLKFLRHACKSQAFPAFVSINSATQLPYEDDFFDGIFTDPPYYDNVPYSHLSDFFYVWLKRSIGDLYPELFSTPLTPKTNEIVAYSQNQTWEEAKLYFETMLFNAFKEIYRTLKPDGIAIIVYAHKTIEGWETVINALLDSGLTITASWPISTELKTRLRARNSAALASSIYIIARKLQRSGIGFFKDVKNELKNHLYERLHRLWEEGIGGADFFIAAIGSGIEVFGKYEKVMDFDGNEVRAEKLLEEVRVIVTDYAVNQILKIVDVSNEISNFTRFYVLWRWNYKTAKIEFDEARKLAQSCGIDVSQEFNKGFIRKSGKEIEVLGPDKRKVDDLQNSGELIDVLHCVLLYWEQNKKKEIEDHLRNSGFGRKEIFYRVAQAISEVLPITTKEKKLLDGFLSGREILQKKSYQQTFDAFITKNESEDS